MDPGNQFAFGGLARNCVAGLEERLSIIDREAPFVGSVGMAFCASFFQDGHDFMGKVDFVGISGGFDQAD